MANPNFWYARYFKDYEEKTAHLSLMEHGAYTLLLDHYYKTRGKLIANAMAIARICRCQNDEEAKVVQSIIDQFFYVGDDGMYHNERADKELGLAVKVSAARSTAGKAGAEKRWGKDKAIANAMASGIANPLANPKQTGWQIDAQPQPHINTPIPPEGAGIENGQQEKPKRIRSGETLPTFLNRCKVEGQNAIPEDDPICDYADTVGLTQQMLLLCWFTFKNRYLQSGKTQTDWRAHYRNAVRRNWYKLWFIGNDGTASLTTAGKQAEREMAATDMAGVA